MSSSTRPKRWLPSTSIPARATREHSIEDTAYKTNLEAAEEVARQLRLRDLAGLIVIDFIDMEDARNDRNVEKRLRDCVKNDRARVQIGKISQFGLLEMSRQRLRAGVVAGSTIPCPTCAGQGIIRSVESTALRVLRALDEEGQRQRATALSVHVPVDVAIYALNQKRREIARMEQDYGLTITFQPMSDMQAGTFEMERIGQRAPEERPRPVPSPDAPLPVAADSPSDELEEEDETIAEEGVEDAAQAAEGVEDAAHAAEAPTNGEGSGRRRRRRRRRGRDRGPAPQAGEAQASESTGAGIAAEDIFQSTDGQEDNDAEEDETSETSAGDAGTAAAAAGEGTGRRKRRRRRRGRRGPRDEISSAANGEGGEHLERVPVDASIRETGKEDAEIPENAVIPAPYVTGALPNAPSEPVWSLFPELPREEASISREEPVGIAAHAADANPDHHAEPAVDIAIEPATITAAEPTQDVKPEAPPAPDQPPRKGWWQRPFRVRE